MSDNKEVKKKIFESTSLNAISLNVSTIIGFLNTYLIVRLIAPEEWALIIVALTFLNFAVFLTQFIPPSANSSIIFYIPQLLAEKEKNNDELVSFIYYNYKNRLLFTIIIYILFCIVIYLYTFGTQSYQIIMILSPLIFFRTLQGFNISILVAFQKFRRLFIVNIINTFVRTVGLLIIFFFLLGNSLILITYLNLFQGIFGFLIALFSIMFILKIKRIKNQKLNYKDYKQNFYKLQKKYGINLLISNLISYITAIIVNVLFLNSGMLIFVTYLAICEHIMYFLKSTSSSKQPISIFSELYAKNKSTYKFYFIKYLKYSSLVNGVLVGFMFFFIEVFIELIYTEEYYAIIFGIQLYFILSFSRLILRTLGMISSSTNKTIIILQVNVFQVSLSIIITIIGIAFSSFNLLIILYIISSYLSTLISFILVNHYTKLNLKIVNVYKPVLLFLTSFIISFIFSSLVNIYIPVFSNFGILNKILNGGIKFLIFLFVHYLAVYFTRYITRDEFDKLIEVIPILNSKKKYIQSITKTLRKCFPSGEKQRNT